MLSWDGYIVCRKRGEGEGVYVRVRVAELGWLYSMSEAEGREGTSLFNWGSVYGFFVLLEILPLGYIFYIFACLLNF